MNIDKYVSSQLTWFLDRNHFNHLVCKYGSNITYFPVTIVQHDMHLEHSTYEVLQIPSISLTDKPPLAKTSSTILIATMSMDKLILVTVII